MQVKVKLYPSSPPRQELRSWEEKLTQAALQQKCQEEALRRREQELAEREIHILERELNIIIHQLYRDKPHVERRQGKFRRHRLKLKDGNRISLPSGETGEGGPPAGREWTRSFSFHFPVGFSRFSAQNHSSGVSVARAAQEFAQQRFQPSDQSGPAAPPQGHPA